MRDLPFGLLPNFVGSTVRIMGPPIGFVGILVRVEILFRIEQVEFARLEDGSVGAFGGIGVDDVRSVSIEYPLALWGNVGGHTKCERKTVGRAEHCVGDAGIAAG